MLRFVCLLIAAACGNLVIAGTPGKAALTYLEQIREGKINLDPNKTIALSPNVLEQKKASINSRLKRLSDELGRGKLELGRERVEGDLAGVLIWKADGFDPSQIQVIALGMVQRGGKWLPAPVPASFENCGVGYRAHTRDRIKALESWMLRSQVEDLKKLRDESIARMRAEIQKHLTRDQLSKMAPREVMDRFLEACSRQNSHEIMGLVGGLSNTLPDNWAVRANSIEAATADLKMPGPWRLLMSQNVLRAVVETHEERGFLHTCIGCLDPQIIVINSNNEPQIEFIHLKLEKSPDGLWQVEAPQYFWEDNSTRPTAAHAQLDKDLLDRFAKEVRKQYQVKAEPTAEKARNTLIKALQSRTFSGILSITDIPDNPISGRRAILRAADAWGSLHRLSDVDNPDTVHLLLDLDMKVREDEASILVHAFSARTPDRYDPHALYLKKTIEGWLWSPNPSETSLNAFKDWSDEATRQQNKKWRAKLLAGCPVVTQLNQAAPSKEEARAVVERLISAIGNGDLLTSLEQCARLDLEDSNKVLLRNLGYEVVDALRGEGNGLVKHTLRKGAWAGVGTHPRNRETQVFDMFPVVNTSKGPRILLEIDLIASSGRGREFLNRTSLTRAAKLGEDKANPIAELFEEHCRICLPDR